MGKELTVTFTTQVTAVGRVTDEMYHRATAEKFADLEAWKKKAAAEIAEFLMEELPADNVIVSDLKLFEHDIPDSEVER